MSDASSTDKVPDAADKPQEVVRKIMAWKRTLPDGRYAMLGINKDDPKDLACYIKLCNGAMVSELAITGETMHELMMMYTVSLRYRTMQEAAQVLKANITWKVAEVMKAKKPNRAKGGKARMAKLTKEQRYVFAKKGAKTRWRKTK